jgi:hypothetical protein
MLGLQDQDLFNRFRYRTVYSLGDSVMADIYKNFMLKTSFTVSPIYPEMLSTVKLHSG